MTRVKFVKSKYLQRELDKDRYDVQINKNNDTNIVLFFAHRDLKYRKTI